MEHDANGLRIVARDECLALLARGGLGRVALSHRALPVILPVSFGLLDEQLVFSVSEGFLLRAASRNDVVCFETDSVDVVTGEAWSVVVTGQLVHAEDQRTLARAADLGIRRWPAREAGEYLILPTTMITGRHTVSDSLVSG